MFCISGKVWRHRVKIRDEADVKDVKTHRKSGSAIQSRQEAQTCGRQGGAHTNKHSNNDWRKQTVRALNRLSLSFRAHKSNAHTNVGAPPSATVRTQLCCCCCWCCCLGKYLTATRVFPVCVCVCVQAGDGATGAD